MEISQTKKFYFASPKSQYLSMKSEIDQAISDVLESETYILGSQVDEFEMEFAKYIGQKYAVGVNSGTDAIILALKVLGVGQGDEVIIPSFTAVATAAAVVAVGAIPVFVDIGLHDFTLDPDLIESSISRNTKAIILVHLYGHPGKVKEISALCKKHSLFFIEDCAQAHGAAFEGEKVGTFSDLACFSFYPTKNLGGIGDGGGITTNSETLNRNLRMLRQYGWGETRNSQIVSQISRLDELQASILRVKLRNLESTNQKRIDLAAIYSELLNPEKFILPGVRPGCKHVYHLFVVRVSNRRHILQELPKANIFPGIHYQWPVHLNDAYASKVGRISGSMNNTEIASETVVSLPMYPELLHEDIQYISEVMNNV